MNIKEIFFIGNNIMYLNEPYKIKFIDFINPGKGRSFIRTKILNLINNKLIKKNFKFTDNIKNADIFIDDYIYLYNNNKIWCFINNLNYNQIFLDKKLLFINKKWICKNNIYKIMFWNNKPIKIILPKYILIKVINDNICIKNMSFKNNFKYVKLSTGVNIKVPIFVNKGDLLKVNPKFKIYISRFNK